MIHLQADLRECLTWAKANRVLWALAPSNAGAFYTDFYSNEVDFNKIDWNAVANRDFRSRSVKEGKQAEFLLKDAFSWSLVEHIGVFDKNKGEQAASTVATATHQPTIRVENAWYF